MSLPFWLFFVGQFVAPALTKRELKVIVPTGLSALVLFLGGAGFGYFMLTPSTIRVSFELNQMLGYTVMWTADNITACSCGWCSAWARRLSFLCWSCWRFTWD